MSASRPPSLVWLTLLIPILMLLGLPSAQAVQPTQAKITKTLWLGGNHFTPLIAPVPKGTYTITNVVDSPCGSYSAGNVGMSAACTSVWQTAPNIVSANTHAVAETGVQYNTSNIGVRREVVTAPPVDFNRASNNVFTGSARAHNHIVAGHTTYAGGVLSGAPSKMSKRGGARFKFDVTSNGAWEINFIVHRRGVLARSAGVTNEARIGEWRPNLEVNGSITNVTHNTSAAVLAGQGSSGILVLAQQVQQVSQSTSNLQVKGKGSGSLLIDADFDMFVDAGDLLGINTLLPSSACWLGGSQMNFGNTLTGSFVDISSVLQPICKTNAAMNEAQGMEVQLVSFLADYDDDGIKDDVDNCTNVKNLSQFDGNADGTGDACDALPPAAPTNLAVNSAGNSVTGKAQPESTVNIYAPSGSLIGTATADSTGNFTAAISPAQVDGQSLRVTATDAGGTSPNAFVTAPDTIAPAAPLNAAINATGTIVTGQAQIGSTVEVKNAAGTIIGSQLVPASGTFSITLNPAQTDGQILTVTARDLGGTSPAITLTAPDLAPPAPPTGLAVNQTGTVVTGSAEPGSAITVRNPAGTVIGTATAGGDGSFSAPISPAQVNGELLSVTAADGGGTSQPATVNAPDTIPPSAPFDVQINATGTVVTGKAQAGSTVEVKDPAGSVIGSQIVPASGDFSITLNPAQTDGQILPVTAKDLGGTSPAVNVTAPDLAAPAAPTNLAVNGTGTVVTGKAEVGSAIEVKDPNGTVIGTGTADNDGNFAVTISPAQTDGELLSVTAADGGGASAPATVNAPDLSAPAAPSDLLVNAAGTVVTGKSEPGADIVVKDPSGTTIGTATAGPDGSFSVPISPAQTNGQVLTVTAADEGGISAPANVNAPDIDAPAAPSNLVVNNTGTRMTGDAQAGSLVIIKDPNGTTIGSGQADASGKFDLALAPAQVNGELLSVTATDNAGTSQPATVNAPDTIAPTAPLNVVINALGTIVSGEAQPGSTVEVKDPLGTVIGTVTVPANGSFDVTLSPAQTNGEILGVTAKDLGGTSPVVPVTAPDLTAPNAPQNPVVNGAGTQVTGQAQPGATVEVRDPSGNSIGSGLADANGDFSVTINPAQTNGEVLQVTATDAGGTSPAADAQAPDITAPTAPLQVVINAQGTIVSGEAQPGSTIEVRDPLGAVIGTVTVAADGNFNVTLNPAQTNAEILSVTAKDAGGTSPVVNVTAPDLTAPDAPLNPVVNATGTQVTGKAQPGSTVEVMNPDGDSIGSGTADANGDFSVTINPAQTNGEVLKVTATDAGGTSPPADAQAPDSTAPDAPLNPVVNPTGTQVTGKAQPGATVEVKDPAGNPIGSGSADANGDFSVIINPAQTNGEVLKVTASDAGGTSPAVDAQAPDLTAPTAPLDVEINDDGTEVTGKAEPGSTVVVKNPAGNPIGSTVVPADGSFSVTLSPAQTNAEILAVTASDAGGSSPVVNVTAPDLTPPNAPENVVVNGAGTQVTGQAQPGSTVDVQDPAGNSIGSATADANGDFTVSVSPAQIDGQVLTVTATDAGGTSAPANAQAPDTTAPGAPTGLVVAPDGSAVTGQAEPGASIEVKDPAGNVIGAGTADSNGDFTVPLNPAQTDGETLDVTAADAGGKSPAAQVQAPDINAANAPTGLVVAPDGSSVTGQAEPGASIEVKDPAGTVIGTGTADSNGDFTVPLNPAQTDGETLAVTAADAGGKSPAAQVQAPDINAPNAPTGLVVAPDGSSVTGQAEPGASIEVKDPTGNVIGSGVADNNGDFTVPLNPAQTNGETLAVTAADAGGKSPTAQVQAPDKTAPAAPTGVVVSPDGTEVSGNAEPGSTVVVKDPAGTPIGSGTADGNGDFTLTISPAQTNGELLEVTAEDGAGNESAAAQAQAPDKTAPAAPTDVVVSPDGTEVTGNAEPGSTVVVKDPAGTPIGSGTADGNGDFTVTISPAQTNGEVLEVTAEDGAGNESAAAQAQAPDTTPPAAPTDLVISPDGTQVTGKAEPGSTVVVKDPTGTQIGSATADANGYFTVTLTPAQTSGQVLDVIAIDAADNESAPAQAQAPNLPPPLAPTNLAVGANGASVTGKAEAGSTVTIYDPSGSVIGTATADASGNFYAALSPAQILGQVLSVTASNANGVSPPASVTAPNLDETLEAGVLMRAWGEFAKDKFGHALAAGDIDGDGHVDVVVGAPHFSRVIPGTAKKVKKVGRVYVYSGRTGHLMRTLDGEVKGDWFGHAVAVLDFDGDGQLDIAVGAPRAKPSPALKGSGKVYVYSGADGSLLATAVGSAKGEQFGTTIVSLLHENDVDLLAVSAPKAKSATGLARAGYVSVLGFDNGTASKAKEAYRIHGELRQEQLGTVLALGPELTGDGYAELAVGLPKANSLSASGKFGLVRVYSTEATAVNSRLIATLDGAQLPATAAGAPRKGDLFGASVATVADMDGDGIDELLIGAPGFDPIKGGKRVNNAGAAFVASSSMLQASTPQANWLATYYGEAKKDQFGWAVANGGVLQAGGDRYHFIAAKGVDVIITNPKNGKPLKANDAGALYGYKAGATERSFKRTGNAKKAHYGNVLLAVGDVDKDGYTDVITASPFMSRYTPINRKWVRNIGFVEVYSGEFIVNRPTP